MASTDPTTTSLFGKGVGGLGVWLIRKEKSLLGYFNFYYTFYIRTSRVSSSHPDYMDT